MSTYEHVHGDEPVFVFAIQDIGVNDGQRTKDSDSFVVFSCVVVSQSKIMLRWKQKTVIRLQTATNNLDQTFQYWDGFQVSIVADVYRSYLVFCIQNVWIISRQVRFPGPDDLPIPLYSLVRMLLSKALRIAPKQ